MAGQPTHISRYEIKSRIGRGGMGDLYLASDPNTNRLVAIKLLNATLDSSELRERFAREARALAALNHPNIVGIYDTGEFEGSPFIVMEYVRGETVAELIRRRAALSVSQKIRLMEELCGGLAQAHEAGIVHRDIKPANLMVDQQNHLKILDFGIARVAEAGRTRIGVPLTQMNVAIGTPGYMSPEQIEGGEIDHRSDIFAVGAVCYELLAYDEAFSGANTNQIESRVLRGTPRPLASVVPGLDPEIDEIVLRALKTDPNKRYQDAATLQRALERFRQRLEPDPEDAPPPRPTSPPPPSTRGKSREARAEAAYQRALASYQSGSRDAARRFAVEAIAEDPGHPGARALLNRLERRPETPAAPAARDNPPPPPPSAGSSAPTMIGGPTIASGATLGAGSTVVSGTPFASDSTVAPGSASLPASTVAARPSPGGARLRPPRESALVSGSTGVSDATIAPATRASARSSDTRSAPASAPTILMPSPSPGRAAKAPFWKSWFSGSGSGAARRAEAARREPPSRKPSEPLWMRYRSAWPVLAILALVAVIGGGALLLFAWLRPSGQVLTVTRPSGGTLTGPGIKCGSAGSDCTSRRPDGETVELTPQADNGFVFRGYTGACAPGGLTIMRTACTCGATFEPLADGKVSPTQTLTISPVPVGGSLEGVDILCGTKGSVCSFNEPDGVPVELHPTADAGYTFMGFTGDCAPLGHTQMNGPRTCGANFQKTDTLAQNGARGVLGGKMPSPPGGGAPPSLGTGASGGRGGGTGPATGSVEPKSTAPATGGGGANTGPIVAPPPPPPPPPPPGVQQPAPAGEVKVPISPEDYAKNAVKDVLKALCKGYEDLSPEAVQQVYPTVNMGVLRMQLNKSQYKSVACTSADPTFESLDPQEGKAKIRVEVKRIFMHSALDPKPDVSEQIADMTLSRASARGRWVIDTATYRQKPKDK